MASEAVLQKVREIVRTEAAERGVSADDLRVSDVARAMRRELNDAEFAELSVEEMFSAWHDVVREEDE